MLIVSSLRLRHSNVERRCASSAVSQRFWTTLWSVGAPDPQRAGHRTVLAHSAVCWRTWRPQRAGHKTVLAHNAVIMTFLLSSRITSKSYTGSTDYLLLLKSKNCNCGQGDTKLTWQKMHFLSLGIMLNQIQPLQACYAMSMHNTDLNNNTATNSDNKCNQCKKDQNCRLSSNYSMLFNVWSTRELLTAVKQNWKFFNLISALFYSNVRVSK